MSVLVKYILGIFSQRDLAPLSPNATPPSLVRSASTPQVSTKTPNDRGRRPVSATYTRQDHPAFPRGLIHVPGSPISNLKGTIADPHISRDPIPAAGTITPVRHPREGQNPIFNDDLSTSFDTDTSPGADSSFNISLISDTSTSSSSDELLASPSPGSPFVPLSLHRHHRDSLSYRSPHQSPPQSPITPIGLGISNIPRKDGKPGSFDGLGVVGIRSSGRRYRYQTQTYTPGPRIPASWRHGFIGSIQEEDEEEADEEDVDLHASPIMGGLSASKFGSRWDEESSAANRGSGDRTQGDVRRTRQDPPRRCAGLGLSRTFLQELMQTWTNDDPFRHSSGSSTRTLASIPENDDEEEAMAEAFGVEEGGGGSDGGFEDIALDDGGARVEAASSPTPGPSKTEDEDREPATPNSLLRAIMAFTPKTPSLAPAATTPNKSPRTKSTVRRTPSAPTASADRHSYQSPPPSAAARKFETHRRPRSNPPILDRDCSAGRRWSAPVMPSATSTHYMGGGELVRTTKVKSGGRVRSLMGSR